MGKFKVVLINGYPGSGKDEFVKFCSKISRVVNIHTSTPAKRALKELGWDGDKTGENRALLCDLKQLSVDYFDGSYEYVREELEKLEGNSSLWTSRRVDIVFIHCREPKELDRFKAEFKAETLLIKRTIEEELTNASDRDVEKYEYDYVINNEGTLDELKSVAMAFSYIVGGKI